MKTMYKIFDSIEELNTFCSEQHKLELVGKEYASIRYTDTVDKMDRFFCELEIEPVEQESLGWAWIGYRKTFETFDDFIKVVEYVVATIPSAVERFNVIKANYGTFKDGKPLRVVTQLQKYARSMCEDLIGDIRPEKSYFSISENELAFNGSY